MENTIVQSDFILRDNELHSWQFGLDLVDDQLAVLARYLSADELRRAAGFHFEQDRRRFIAGRGTLRSILADYMRCKPGEIAFGYGRRGKPVVTTGTLRFNLAHSDVLGVVGVTRSRPIGVDLERHRPIADFMGIAGRFFSAIERDTIAALSVDQRLRAFFRCWTRKEAFVKATGDGIGVALDSFTVPVNSGAPSHGTHELIAPIELADWSFWDLPVGEDFTGAVAFKGQIQVLQHRICYSSR
jgi:4'-phosphopantetheinyl transferase